MVNFTLLVWLERPCPLQDLHGSEISFPLPLQDGQSETDLCVKGPSLSNLSILPLPSQFGHTLTPEGFIEPVP